MQNEGDESGGDRCADLTAGSETGARRDIPSNVVDVEECQRCRPLRDWHRVEELRPYSSSREVGQGSPDQAHQPWRDISVPEQLWPSWQEV